LRAPRGRATRPTSDRVRESVFDMLASLGTLPGGGPVEDGDPELDEGRRDEGPRVVDLFAGSGALGIEARSRGAVSVTFVESDAGAAATIEANLRVLGWADAAATVVRADARTWVRGPGAAVLAGTDLVLADPPYAFEGWDRLLEDLAASGFGGVAVLEAGEDISTGGRWNVLRARRYGTTVVQLVRPALLAGVPADPKGGA
jgi:16S rRNA (guanine966-N2)-methyltransferase